MPKYRLRNGSRVCSLACSVAVVATGVGQPVGPARSSGRERSGECGDASPAPGRQLRIRPLQCTPTRRALATHGLALGGPQRISRSSRGSRRRARAQGPIEERLVEELAGVIWRKRRLRLGESAAHHRALKRASDPDGETARAAVINLIEDIEADCIGGSRPNFSLRMSVS